MKGNVSPNGSASAIFAYELRGASGAMRPLCGWPQGCNPSGGSSARRALWIDGAHHVSAVEKWPDGSIGLNVE